MLVLRGFMIFEKHKLKIETKQGFVRNDTLLYKHYDTLLCKYYINTHDIYIYTYIHIICT